MQNKSFTLIEVLLAIFIIVVAIGAIALLYPGMLSGLRQDTQNLRAWEIAKQQMEALKNTSVASLYAVSYDPQAAPLINTFATGVANTAGVYYVEQVRDATGATLTDIVKVEVIVCYSLGNRVIGEDLNLNGALDAQEDINNDRKISSTVRLTTLVMQP